MIGQDESSQDKTNRVRLIDFGISEKYRDKNGAHVPAKPNAGFQGSLNFVSASVMSGHNAGRKDDLISLCYLILYLVEDYLFSRKVR